jgi:hypothetical protein
MRNDSGHGTYWGSWFDAERTKWIGAPRGNATGINFFVAEVAAKRLRLRHDLVPKAGRIALLLNPANVANAEVTLREVQQAAPTIGLQIRILNASTISEIDAAFAAIAHEHSDAVFVGSDAFFTSRRGQFVTLTAVNKVPAAYGNRDFVAAGRLKSYGSSRIAMSARVPPGAMFIRRSGSCRGGSAACARAAAASALVSARYRSAAARSAALSG